MAFDSGSAVAVTADAERIFSGDLHQIGGFPEDARYLLVLHPRSILALAFRSNPTALCGARSHRNSRTPGGRRGLRSKLRYKLLRTRPDSSWVYVAGGRPGGGLRIVGFAGGRGTTRNRAAAGRNNLAGPQQRGGVARQRHRHRSSLGPRVRSRSKGKPCNCGYRKHKMCKPAEDNHGYPSCPASSIVTKDVPTCKRYGPVV